MHIGTPEQLFARYYKRHCENALDEFFDRHLRCCYYNKKGCCAAVAAAHTPKGHQREDGVIIGAGNYQSLVKHEQIFCTWIRTLTAHLEELQNRKDDSHYRDPSVSPEGRVSRLHRTIMVEFYHTLGNAANFMSHTTCLCCLRELPEHPLTCGHVLCTPCILSYGTDQGTGIIAISECPLHPGKEHWHEPCIIKLKPALAGVRVLCLDGYGRLLYLTSMARLAD